MKILFKICQACDFAEMERAPRSWWMRPLGSLRLYQCNQCKTNVLAPKTLVESRQWMTTTLKNFQAPPASEPNAD
jgi:hypothetical protein